MCTVYTPSGVVYSCGLNDAHQLGLGSAPNSTPKQCLTPTPITVSLLLPPILSVSSYCVNIPSELNDRCSEMEDVTIPYSNCS